MQSPNRYQMGFSYQRYERIYAYFEGQIVSTHRWKERHTDRGIDTVEQIDRQTDREQTDRQTEWNRQTDTVEKTEERTKDVRTLLGSGCTKQTSTC